MANRYWVGGNDNWDATAGTKWALTSGGAGGQAVPTASDDVFLDNGTGHGNVTITATAAAKSLNCTGYVDTLTVNAVPTISGSVTFVAGMTLSGSSTFIINGTGTVTFGGKTYAGKLSFRGSSQTFTIADAVATSGILEVNGSGTTHLTDGGSGSISAAGGLTVTSAFDGTCPITLTGGTWSGTGSMIGLLTFAGDVTVSGTVAVGAGSITYSSGTITTTGSTLNVTNAATLNTAGVTWNLVKLAYGGNITINSLLLAATIEYGNNSVILVGTAGYTCATLQNVAITVARTLTLTQTNTYTVTSALNIAGNATYSLTLQSSHATDHVPFDFTGASSPNLNYVNATRINSNGGLKIYTTGAVVTSDNWEHVDAAGATPNTMRNVYNQAIHRASIW